MVVAVLGRPAPAPLLFAACVFHCEPLLASPCLLAPKIPAKAPGPQLWSPSSWPQEWGEELLHSCSNSA